MSAAAVRQVRTVLTIPSVWYWGGPGDWHCTGKEGEPGSSSNARENEQLVRSVFWGVWPGRKGDVWGAVKSLQDFIPVTVVTWPGIRHLKVISKNVAGRLTTPEMRNPRNQLFLMFDRLMGTVPTQCVFCILCEEGSRINCSEWEGRGLEIWGN